MESYQEGLLTKTNNGIIQPWKKKVTKKKKKMKNMYMCNFFALFDLVGPTIQTKHKDSS